MKLKEASEKNINRRNWISFSVFAVASLVGIGGWRWLRSSAVENKTGTGGLPGPVRNVLNGNAAIAEKAFNAKSLVKTYPKAMAAKKVRYNGSVGLMSLMDEWKLDVIKNNGEHLYVSLDEIKKLPRQEIVFDFKCIEGWDQISHWGGVRCSDFLDHFGLQEEAEMKYMSLITPDERYYVGIDMPSVLHPQTLLAYEVNGRPLPPRNGYPLRLIIPVKYGIKNLKRIGKMSFSAERPPDYWAERGYDYFSGL